MVLRLDNLVECGEIINTTKYSVHGWLGLKGREGPLVLDLTGDCDPDLRGRRFRFEARPGSDQDLDGPSAPEGDDIDLSGLAWRQIGPTGTMTAARTREVADGSGSRPIRCLCLEWSGQNGPISIELEDPIIELIEAGESDAADDAEEGEDDAPFEGWTGEPGEDGEEEDGYGLISEELQRDLDREAAETDRSIKGEDGSSDVIREMELMDDLIERGEGDPIGTILEETVKLPSPDALDDEGAERELKRLLALLAKYNIALSICEHFTPRDAYRLLLEHICIEESAYPELRSTQWVQHFMTAEFCEECEAEMDREFEERQRREGDLDDQAPPGVDASDDDPF
ncbi:MAG: hypothetical protein JXQ73_06675 [Phycisphaerae bacterium]|nr:hypothetical protein [Phycisphaerae bacterium]